MAAPGAFVTRVSDRHKFTMPVRMQLAEGDLDSLDAHLVELNARLGKIMWAIVGLLISVTTGSLLVAINLVAR